jgi:hypothetical protein
MRPGEKVSSAGLPDVQRVHWWISTVFHTNATQINGWEKIRVIDQGNGTYKIQTAGGFFVGIYKDSSGISCSPLVEMEHPLRMRSSS